MTTLRGRCRGRRQLEACGDRGATAVEYAIMVGFIAAVIVVAVAAFGGSVKGLFEFIVTSRPFG